MSRPLRVFLCHASQDKPAVKNLYRYLTQRGVQPWLDELDLLPGQHWETEIPQALFSSDVILVCLSKNSINKEGYVQKEIAFALDKAQEKPEGTIFVIPVKLEQCEVPRRLSMYQWVDYFRPDGKRRLLLGLSLRADTLGDEVSPVLLDITRRRKPLESDSAGREAREKAAREQAEREAAEKLARKKVEGVAKANVENDAKEKREASKRIAQSSQNRVLEAAIQKLVVVHKPVSLYVWIKQVDSKSIISIIRSDVDEHAVLDEDNVKSNGLEIEFPVKDGVIGDGQVSLRLVAPDFFPSTQQKEIKVPVNGDSDVCTFLVVPKKAGELLLNIEVLKDKFSVGNRSLWTTAIEAAVKETVPMILVSMPIYVVASKFDVVNIGGDVSDSTIISGDDNFINTEKVERDAAESAAREKQEREQKEQAEREAAEKLAREKAAKEAKEKLAREKTEREEAEKVARPKNVRRQIGEISAPERVRPHSPAPQKAVSKQPQSFPIPVLVLGVILLGLLFWGISALLNREPAAPPPEQSTATVTITPAVPTRTPTATHTSAPPTFTATPGIGSTMISEKDGMVMVYVPAGEFTMGNDNGEPDEKPVHQVYLDAFWIDRTEVTNAMFAEFVEKEGYTTDAEKAGRSYVYQGGSWTQVNGADWQHPLGPASGITDIMNHPVVHVSWNDAKAYCSWADRRLPTEAEWEKAASWDDEKAEKRIYPWGNEFDGSRLNFCDKNCPFSWSDKNSDDGYEFTSPVGNYVFGRSPYGTYDMAGNVWEWVSSLYKNYPYSADDGRENLSASGSRVLRGGSWNDGDINVRSANRFRYDPSFASIYIGFRCSLASP